jgi:hypothetical protein
MDSSDHPPHNQPMNKAAAEQQLADGPAPGSTSPATPRPKKTIMDLARYRFGQRVYWIVFRMHRDPTFEFPVERMRDEHPWMQWRFKLVPWSVPMKPPRTHPADTMMIMMLCGQRPKIEPFRITDIARSANLGTFLYTGSNGVVMPEGLLFPTKKAARREIARIAKMFAAWTGTWEEGLADGPPAKE